MLQRRRMLQIHAALLAACSPTPAPPAAIADPVEVAAAPDPPAPPPAVPIDPQLADRFPSLEHYPGIDPALRDALERHAGPREILAALATSFAPYRWPNILDWDRHGFIDLHADEPGFVTRLAGGIVAQARDHHDLGCAGGFLEGVRLTLLPTLAVADLDRCDLAAVPVDGGPAGCDTDREYGWLALANIARQLRPQQLPAGLRLLALDPHQSADLTRLMAPRAVHLCTVSHISAAFGQARFYHHMMIVLGTPGGRSLEVFDTTGGRGVALVGMSREQFVRYVATALRANREFKYLGRGTTLSCLPVTTR